MSTFALIHGAGDVGWYWHLVEAELRARGHGAVAPDLPADDDSLGLGRLRRRGGRGHRRSQRPGRGRPVLRRVYRTPGRAPAAPDALVLVAGMIPFPREPPGDWWENTGYSDAVREQAARDGGLTGNQDPYVSFYHDVPRSLAEEAMSRNAPIRPRRPRARRGHSTPGRRANEVRAVHRGPLLPARLPPAASRRAPAHHAR